MTSDSITRKQLMNKAKKVVHGNILQNYGLTVALNEYTSSPNFFYQLYDVHCATCKISVYRYICPDELYLTFMLYDSIKMFTIAYLSDMVTV